MAMTASALVRDLQVLNERLQVAPPPDVTRRVRMLIREALGLLPETPPVRIASRTVSLPFTPERAARYAPAPETLSGEDARAVMAEAQQRGRQLAGSVYASVGPALSPAEVAAQLGTTRATVHNWRKSRRLLALHPNRHSYVYPAFQFTDTGESEDGLLVGLGDVLAALGETSELGKALWFQARQPALGGQTPVEVMRRERDRGVARVTAAAAAAYAQGG